MDATVPKQPDFNNRVLALRERLVNAAVALVAAVKPAQVGEAVVTVLVRDGTGRAAVRFPSSQE
jgi:hypothetical protein